MVRRELSEIPESNSIHFCQFLSKTDGNVDEAAPNQTITT